MKLKNKFKIKKFFKKSKGFSLIEVLVAMFIFILAITMLIGGFSSFFKNYIVAKKIQKDVENAQYAMNLMAKTLRTSSVVSNSSAFSPALIIYDYSQNLCIEYSYSDNAIKYRTSATPPANLSDPSSCSFSGTPTSMTSNDIIHAYVAATQTGATLGKVTIVLYVQDQSGTVNQPSAIPIQMSVSLRQ